MSENLQYLKGSSCEISDWLKMYAHQLANEMVVSSLIVCMCSLTIL